ncbi:hypothetical protein ASA1KI_41810 [Opitutales bacterium ASA1]|uniref:S8 family peptidase n=1 Tax=Congregicoccus parvus TaxID=3081749 RepID=UPI002B2E9604|nr:hypothetical protein ASA1KI_41810 [Opitutales bacterium ASA1]
MPTVLYKGHEVHATRILAQVKAGTSLDEQVATLARERVLAARDYALVPGLVMLEIDEPVAVMSAGETPEAIQTRQAQRLHATIEALQRSGLYEYVEPDYIVRPYRVPTDAAFTDGRLWGLRNTGQNGGSSGVDIDAVRAWDITTGSSDVIAAVIDSGIRYTHQDLAANMWRNPGEIPGNGIDDDGNGYVDDVHGINAINGSGNPMDDDGHGTHVAGTIGAVANNSGEHVGVAWNVRLMALKFLSASGSGTTTDAIEAIDYAVANGARILNCSWGGSGNSAALRASLQGALSHGVLVVASAGNAASDNDRLPVFPAGYELPNLVSVASINRHGHLSGFSNFGLQSVHLVAPGEEIFSTHSVIGQAPGHAIGSGTSMAAPHVSGAAALVLAHHPQSSVRDLRDRLLGGTMSMPELASRIATGGRLDAYRALVAQADGRLESFVSPVSGRVLVAGRSQRFEVRLTDVTGVTGADVSLETTTGTIVTLRDDGAGADVIAGDATYTALVDSPTTSGEWIVRVRAAAGGKQPYERLLRYALVQAAANDDFARRTVLEGRRGADSASNFGATLEPGEPVVQGMPGGASLWWAWTAPRGCIATFDTLESDFDTTLAVYTGTALSGLSLVVANDDAANADTGQSLASFRATSGTTYFVRVDGFSGRTGRIALRFETATASPNENFDEITELRGTTASAVADLYYGTRWFRWVAPASGVVEFSSSTGESAVYVDGRWEDLDAVWSRRSTLSQPGIVFRAEAGVAYRLALRPWATGGAADSDVDVRLEWHPFVPNDDFAGRVALEGSDVSASADNTFATLEPGEPGFAEGAFGASLWWSWTPAVGGRAVLTLVGGANEVGLRVHTGDALANLQVRAESLPGPWWPNGARLVFDAKPGVTYHVEINGSSATSAQSLLRFRVIDGPDNDAFADALVLAGADVVSTVDNTGATREPDEPMLTAYGSGATVWWRWTAPFSGTATFTLSSGFLGVFEGEALTSLTRLSPFGPIVRSAVLPAVEGRTYSIWADGVFGYIGNLTLTIGLVVAPANDLFEARIPLVGAAVSVSATLKASTLEPGEREHGERPLRGSLWWEWTAPASARTKIWTIGASPHIRVDTGDALGVLVAVQDELRQLDALDSFVFDAVEGTRYHISLVGYPQDGTVFELRLQQGAAPENDHFSNRATLAGIDLTVNGDNTLANRETDEPYGGMNAASTVWWQWTAPSQGWAELRSDGSDFPVAFAAFTLQPNAPAQLEFLDRTGGLVRLGDESYPLSAIGFPVRAGTVYFIRIDGYERRTGSFQMHLGLTPAPANDPFADATVLEGASHVVRADLRGATNEVDEPRHTDFWFEGGSLWWRWIAPASGTAVVELEGDYPIAALAVYEGDALVDLAPVIAHTRRGRVAFRAETGDVFHIALGSSGGAAGAFGFSVQLHEGPPNDQFADRIRVSGTSFEAAADLSHATREREDPGGEFIEGSLWWTWRAPESGRVVLQARAELLRTFVSVSTGDELGELLEVVSRWQSLEEANAVVFDAIAGTEYHIALIHPAGEAGEVLLSLQMVVPPANDDFERSIEFSGLPAEVRGSNFGAVQQEGEGRLSNRVFDHSVWWTWTAPADGWVVVSLLDSAIPTRFEVYRGTTIESLTQQPLEYLDGDFQDGIRFLLNAVAGEKYHFRIAGAYSEMGEIVLKLLAPAAPELPEALAVASLIEPGDALVLSTRVTGYGLFQYQWLFDGVPIEGATSSTHVLPSAQWFLSGRYSVRVSNRFGTTGGSPAVFALARANPSKARLLNLSTRAFCGSGDNTMIPGFVLRGHGEKRILIRAAGPSLEEFGVQNPLADPGMSLLRQSDRVSLATNDNWDEGESRGSLSSVFTTVGASPFVAGERDSALLIDLAEGAYTAVVSGVDGGSGISVVELFDPLEGPNEARLVNLSNRGFVGEGADVMIPGFVISYEGPKVLLLRAVGPGLLEHGVTGVLADPKLTVYRTDPATGAQEPILWNDNWGENGDAADIAAVAARVGAFPLEPGSKDAAFVITLQPGVYTVHAAGADGGTGVALVELYLVE